MDISFAFRKIQKSIAGLSVLAVLTSLVSFTGIASAYDDLDEDHYAYDAIMEAADEGWMTGYENGDFGADDSLTRAQAAKIFLLGSGLDLVEDCETDFTDVPTTHDLYEYVCSAEAYGIVSGRTDADGDLTGKYDPDAALTRAEGAKLAVETFGLTSVSDGLDNFPDVDLGEWYEKADTYYVSTAWSWSVVNGFENGYFYPGYNFTRGQAAIVVNNAQEPEWRELGDDDDDDTTTSEGDLMVEVSNDSPDMMTIPSNATSVELAAWDFTAEDGDVTVDSITVHQYGISSLSSAHQVYLYEGSTRLTSGTTFSSTDNEVTFTYDVEIEDGDTRTLSVRMDMGEYTTASEVGLEIVSASKVEAYGASVDGDFPLQAEKHDISSTDAGSVTFEKNGTVENSEVGEDDATIGKFKVTSATEAAGLEEIGVYVSGSVNTADIENFELYVVGDDAEPIAEVAGVDDLDVARFVIDGEWDSESDECENSDGYCIAKGGTKSFYVVADFNTGRTDDTVKISIDQNTDVLARGGLYGFGMQVTRTTYDGDSCTSTAGDCSYSVLEGGDVTISSNGPAADDIATNAKDVHLLDFNIVSVTDVTFDSFPISLTASEGSDTDEGLWQDSDDAANFTDVKIWNNETESGLFAGVDSSVFKQTIGGTNITDGTDGATAYHLFTEDFEMDAGEELDLALTTDVRNDTALDGMTVVGALALGTTYPQMKDVNNKTLTNSTVLVPASPVTGKTMTIRTPSLALSLASTPVAGGTNYVKGTEDVPFTGIVMACGNASDCRVTSVSLVGTIDEDGGSTFASTAGTPGVDNAVNVNEVVGSVWLVDEDGEMVEDSSASVTASTGLVTMDNLDLTIPAGDSPVYTVVGNVKSDAFKNNNAESIAFKVTSASNVVVEDEEGNTISATGTVNAPSATTATSWVVVTNGGSITVSVDPSTAREDLVVADTDDVSASMFKFTSTSEAFTVRKLAVSADQNGVADADLGEYDNQVNKVYLTYEDSDGNTVTDSASLVSGNATFTDLDLYVEKDGSATVEVTADLNSIASGQATAGDPVRLDLALNNFEARAESSGETYKADKLDNDVLATSDLDLGSLTWTDSSKEIDGAGTAAALGVNQTLLFDNEAGADPDVIFPVGTLICTSTGDDATCTVGTDEIYVVTAAQADGATEDTLTVMLIDNATADVTTTKSSADNDDVLYILPGDGYLDTTNPMYVYETKPTLALASSSASGTRTVTSDDSAFVFNVSANAKELVQVRAAQEASSVAGFDSAGANNAAPTTTTAAGTMVDGSGSTVTLSNYLASDSVFVGQFTNDVVDYARVSFWIRFVDSGADNAVTFAGLKTNVINTATADPNTGGVALSQALCGADQSTLVSGEWYRCDVAVAGAVAGEKFFSIELDALPGTITNDVIQVDDVLAYNEKIVVDVSTDGDVDTYANNTANAGSPSQADLKEGNTTLAVGFWESSTNGASATSTATVTFIPTTAIEVAKGTPETYTLHVNSSALLNEDSGSDDPVTFSMDAGSSVTSGDVQTITAGDFWWHETNATVKWLGDVSSRVTGNTLTY